MKSPVLLCFNMPPEKAAKLRLICMRFSIRFQPVPREDWGKTLSALCGLEDEMCIRDRNTHMSLKVCSVGVLPLIFAYSFLAFPGTIIQLVGGTNSGAYIWWNTYMNTGSVWYMIISALLIMAFTFFYSSISFDAKRQAEQLTMQGAVIPGQRGKNIRGFLQTTVNRLNLFSALFLAILAAVPTILTTQLNTAEMCIRDRRCPSRLRPS